MYLLKGTDALVTSASDLKLASECEFAFLRVLDHRLGWSTDPLPPDDPMLVRAAGLGGVHERQVLERYRAEHGDGVVELPDADRRSPDALRRGAAETIRALQQGAAVVYQGVFYDETDPGLPFVGFADFLVRRSDGRYRVVDTKLARRVRTTALLQLAAYHEQLERLEIPLDDTVELILGDGRSETASIDDIAPVFRLRRERMHTIIAEHRAEGTPVVWGDDRYEVDGRCKYCEGPAAEAEDLVTVAGMRLAQRAKLRAAGITTLPGLAATAEPPPGLDLPGSTFAKLQLQAQLQLVAASGAGRGVPPYVVTDLERITALPPPSPGDLFFDFEGDPMYAEPGPSGPRWGLDYLFGWVDAAGDFDCRWAHSQSDERAALRSFLDFVAQRRQRYPDLHIYHYAAYERTHLLSIASRHGEGEAEVDALLRAGVLVDLYPVVRASLRVGVPSYSIKHLEPLYMGDELRTGVTNAADSVDQYVASRLALEGGDETLATEIRASIADYNAYDCRSTLALRDWLRALPAAASSRPLPIRDAADDHERAGEATTAPFRESELDIALQELGGAAIERDDPESATVYRLAAAAIDYHRREAKSFWWEHFARLEQPADEWEDTRGVLRVEHGEVERDWHVEGRQRSERRHLRLHGDWAPGSGAPRPGGELFLVYDGPPPGGTPGERAGMRVPRPARFGDPATLPDGSVSVVETRGADSERWSRLPSHLAPAAPPKADSLVAAIASWGAAVRAAAPEWPRDAMTQLLRRQPVAAHERDPGYGATTGLEPMRDADDGVRATVASLRALRRGFVAIQGPPGTGKTYLAAHVIAELVRDQRWRVGVTAQSHKAVENVLEEVVLRTDLDHELVGKAPSSEVRSGRSGAIYTELPKNAHQAFASARERTGYVLGGTAWDLTNRNRVGADQLDLLVIDEAGQFSLAATIAVATSAKRILLLGDPQQLPQVSQGIHPVAVDGSALGHLIGAHDVLPSEFGYFLAETRRMDGALTDHVSNLSYDGRLRAHPTTTGRLLGDVLPGLHPVPVRHVGNATSSVAEADEVVAIARRHLGLPWTEEAGGTSRTTDQADVIVVTPYNAQMELIRGRLDAAGLVDVEVGTVDKFQGREAVISIVSLAASSAADVPRGLDFLLSRNRLNVSISRAKWAAYLIYSPALRDSLPLTPEGIATLSRFIRLTEANQAEVHGRALGQHLAVHADREDREARFARLRRQIAATPPEEMEQYRAESRWWDAAAAPLPDEDFSDWPSYSNP